MTDRMSPSGRGSPVRRVARRLAGTGVLGLPRPLLALVVVVDLLALGLIVAAVVRGTAMSPAAVSWADAARGGAPWIDTAWAAVAWAAALAALGVAHAELTRRIDYLDVRLSGAHTVTLDSTWVFAAALVLPPSVSWAVAVVIYAHGWFSVGRQNVIILHRRVYTTASMVLAAFAAHAVATAVDAVLGGGPVALAGIALGLLAFTVVNTGLVGLAIGLSTPRPSLAVMIGTRHDNLLELCTLCLGGLAAAGFVVHPVLLLFAVPPLLVLHRSARAHQLAEAAATDGKTGLLNAAAWHSRAEAALAERRARRWGLLVLDLDHFKRVNDTHGHLVGDDVLAAVARAVTGEVRDRDLVGRFGGEEFVVLLALAAPGDDPGAVDAEELELGGVAERIRAAVAALSVQVATADGPLTISGVTVSIGAAVADGRALHDLMQSADAALYAAKRGGRDQVRVGAAPVPGHVAARDEARAQVL